jgi:hypothetical protein
MGSYDEESRNVFADFENYKMNIYSNYGLPEISSNSSSYELLQYIVLVISRRLQYRKAFKGGFLLTKLLGSQARATRDVDFSVDDKRTYDVVKIILAEIGDTFKKVGIIDEYIIKESVNETSAGGVVYKRNGTNIVSVDVGLHQLRTGITTYDFDIGVLDGFEVERMMADKIVSILSHNRYRRTKDLYDFWAISNNFSISIGKLVEYIKMRGGADWDNIPFSEEAILSYKLAWDKLVLTSVEAEELYKPEFDEVLYRFYKIALPAKAGAVNFIWDCKSFSVR